MALALALALVLVLVLVLALSIASVRTIAPDAWVARVAREDDVCAIVVHDAKGKFVRRAGRSPARPPLAGIELAAGAHPTPRSANERP